MDTAVEVGWGLQVRLKYFKSLWVKASALNDSYFRCEMSLDRWHRKPPVPRKTDSVNQNTSFLQPT